MRTGLLAALVLTMIPTTDTVFGQETPAWPKDPPKTWLTYHLGHPGLGTLVPGGVAHYAVWEVGDLIVEAPDDRIQAWSTDPRSGTPGLPDLRPGAAAPRCLRTVVWGASIG